MAISSYAVLFLWCCRCYYFFTAFYQSCFRTVFHSTFVRSPFCCVFLCLFSSERPNLLSQAFAMSFRPVSVRLMDMVDSATNDTKQWSDQYLFLPHQPKRSPTLCRCLHTSPKCFLSALSPHLTIFYPTQLPGRVGSRLDLVCLSLQLAVQPDQGPTRLARSYTIPRCRLKIFGSS